MAVQPSVPDMIEQLKEIRNWLDGTQRLVHSKLKRGVVEDKNERMQEMMDVVKSRLIQIEKERQSLDVNDPRSGRLKDVINQLNDKVKLLQVSINKQHEMREDQKKFNQVKSAPKVPKRTPGTSTSNAQVLRDLRWRDLQSKVRFELARAKFEEKPVYKNKEEERKAEIEADILRLKMPNVPEESDKRLKAIKEELSKVHVEVKKATAKTKSETEFDARFPSAPKDEPIKPKR